MKQSKERRTFAAAFSSEIWTKTTSILHSLNINYNRNVNVRY